MTGVDPQSTALDGVIRLMAQKKFAEASSLSQKILSAHPDDTLVALCDVYASAASGQAAYSLRRTEQLLVEAPQFQKVIDADLFDPGSSTSVGAEIAKRRDACVLVAAAFAALAAGEVASRFGVWHGVGLLAGLGLLVMLAEVVVRLWAAARYTVPGMGGEVAPPHRLDATSIHQSVYSSAVTAYDPVGGYSYSPNAQGVRVDIAKGRVIACSEYSIDALGNTGHSDPAFKPDGLNVLVVGDSFTGSPGNGAAFEGRADVEWPYLLKLILQQQLGRDVNVKNFGRESFGVLQMVDVAAAQCRVDKPDIVIIAFILRDLTRPRRSQTTLKSGNDLRSVLYMGVGAPPPLSQASDTRVIDPRVSKSWAEVCMQKGDDDPLLQELNDRYATLLRRNDRRAFSIFNMARLCLLDLVAAGTIFARRGRSFSESVRLTDYNDDPHFKDAVATLRQSGSEIYLVMLPEVFEIAAGGYITKQSNHSHLLMSLMKAFGQNLVGIRETDKSVIAELTRRFKRSRFDIHPSFWAMKWYAEKVATHLLSHSPRARSFVKK